MKKNTRKTFYITTPIYYVNDQPHIGHAYSTLVADVLTRFHTMKGDSTWFLVGTDEHGSKVQEAALKAGQQPQEFVDRISSYFRNTWKSLNITYNDFIRTTEERHKKSVCAFMQQLYDAGYIYEGVYEGLYCTGCERFYTTKELNEKGECPDHKRKPELIKEKNYFFKLKDFIPDITRDIESDRMEIYPPERKNEMLALLQNGLDDFSVSRERVTWGIPLPFDSSQRIYVWVEALQNYISALGYFANIKEQNEKFSTFWPADIQVIGKDITKFHCIFWPALLKAVELPLPKKFIVTGFFTVDGQKMSKTLGNVIDPNDLVKDFGVDGARYLILSQFAVGADGDIKAQRFIEKYNADLANNLGNLVSRVSHMIMKYCNGVIIRTAQDTKHFEKISREIYNSIETGKLDVALSAIFQDGFSILNKEIEEAKPWELAKHDTVALSAHLSRWAQHIEFYGKLLSPFLPETSQKIVQAFSGPSVQKSEILFPKK